MKIHESMNVSLHEKLLFPFLAALLWLFAGSVSGQAPGLDVYNLTILKDDTFHFDTIRHYSVGVHPEIKRQPGHGVAYFNPRPYDGNPAGEPNYPHLGFKAPGGYNNPSINYLHYIPAPGFTGRDTIEVFYHRKFGNSGATLTAYKIYNILVVPSFLFAENDYASTTVGQAVEIDVLANDFGNGTNLTVAEITNVNSGTAVRTAGNTKVLFTPAAGFTGVGHLNYTICDAQGSCDMATVSICVNPVTIPAYDSIFVTTKKNTPQVIILALDSNYALTTPPAHGDLDSMETLVYVPDLNYTGYDQFVFYNAAANRTRVVQIRVLDASGDWGNVFLFDDVVFTPMDEMVEEIRLLDNDNGAQWLMNIGVLGYPNTAEGGHLTYLPSVGKGVYRYEPPAGFEGVDKFTYRATPPYGNSSSYEYATCYIVVTNLNPSEPVFHITTPKNTPLVLGDHLPFLNYEYVNYSNGDAGTVEFHAGFATVTSPYGQTFSGNNMLIYTPDEDFTGEDEFEFNYCPGGQNNNCPLVKVEVEVVEVSNPQADTLCAGSDCVWSGDTNRDGLVDVRDILPIGLCMGEAGQDRANGSVAWYGQYADNWNSFSACLEYDAKHVDSDGNGIVASQDTTAISQFYGMYHNLTPEPASAISELPFYIEEPDYSNIEPGDVLYAPIHLGNDSIAAIDAYGLTFQLEYDPAIFESVNVNFYNTSWMSYNSPLLSMAKKPFLGRIDAGYTRTSGQAASGYGVIGVVEFIVIDDIAGGRLNKNSTTVNLHPLGMMNGSGETFGLNGNSITFHLNLNGEPKEQEVTEAQLNVFPNPAGEFVNVHLNGYGNEMGRVQLYNLIGEVVYDSGSLQAKRLQVKLSDLAQGVYMMEVHANDGTVLKSKVEVIK